MRISLFVGALLLLSVGYPVAFCLGAVAIFFGFIGVGFGFFEHKNFNCATLVGAMRINSAVHPQP